MSGPAAGNANVTRLSEPEQQERQKSPWWAIVVGFALIAGVVALAALVLYRIYPGDAPTAEDPTWLDMIFDSALVIFASRILLFSIALVLAFASVYTILSITSWTRHRQWLTKAGPFEVSRDAIETLHEQVEFWRQTAVAENEEAQMLRNRLQETEAMLDILLEDDEDEGGA